MKRAPDCSCQCWRFWHIWRTGQNKLAGRKEDMQVETVWRRGRCVSFLQEFRMYRNVLLVNDNWGKQGCCRSLWFCVHLIPNSLRKYSKSGLPPSPCQSLLAFHSMVTLSPKMQGSFFSKNSSTNIRKVPDSGNLLIEAAAIITNTWMKFLAVRKTSPYSSDAGELAAVDRRGQSRRIHSIVARKGARSAQRDEKSEGKWSLGTPSRFGRGEYGYNGRNGITYKGRVWFSWHSHGGILEL